MAIVARLRSRKRQFGMPEGVIESVTPIAAITRKRFLIPASQVKVAQGVAEGPEAGVWYYTAFPEPILDGEVVAVARARRGEIVSRKIAKVQDILPKTLAKVPNIATKTIERVTRDDFNSANYCEIVAAGARDRALELGPPFPLDGIWSWFCNSFVYLAFYAGWYAAGWILNVLWDSFLQPQIDKVRNSINSVVSDANTKINGQIDKLTEDVNDVIGDLNAKVNSQIDQVTDRVNLVLGDLYAMWGLPFDLAMTTVNVRNVSDNGFEWLSLGQMTIHWIAVGKSA